MELYFAEIQQLHERYGTSLLLHRTVSICLDERFKEVAIAGNESTPPPFQFAILPQSSIKRLRHRQKSEEASNGFREVIIQENSRILPKITELLSSRQWEIMMGYKDVLEFKDMTKLALKEGCYIRMARLRSDE